MRDVSVVYSGGVDALHNVNLKINDGDFAFVVGPSGAGKSTMIKLILKEIKSIPKEKIQEIVRKNLVEIEKGNRDFRF